MNEVPEEAGTRPERAAPSALTGEPTLWEAGSVCVLSSAVGLGLSQRSDGRYERSPVRYCPVLLIFLPAKAETRGTAAERRAERDAGTAAARPGVPTVEVGKAGEPCEPAGSGGRVEAASDGPPGRTVRERDAARSRRGRGAESAGWREVAAWCHASEGVSHR
jgi:hypothetical protein